MKNFDLKKYLVENKLTINSKLNETYSTGDIYQNSKGDKFQILPLPDRFKNTHGAGTLNIWVKNMQTNEEHFVPQSILRSWKEI